jgi:propionyl-CoA carboxylase alpha chain
VVHHRLWLREGEISGRLHPSAPVAGAEWVVLVEGTQHPVTVAETAEGFAVIGSDSSHELVGQWRFGEPLFQATVNGEAVAVQLERRGVGYVLSRGGIQLAMRVLAPRAAALAELMPVKPPPDLSRFLLSPMPGLLASVAVTVGQEVKAGQELAVVEAMKMENLLRAERDGRVARMHAAPGDSLAVDQAILEFE